MYSNSDSKRLEPGTKALRGEPVTCRWATPTLSLPSSAPDLAPTLAICTCICHSHKISAKKLHIKDDKPPSPPCLSQLCPHWTATLDTPWVGTSLFLPQPLLGDMNSSWASSQSVPSSLLLRRKQKLVFTEGGGTHPRRFCCEVPRPQRGGRCRRWRLLQGWPSSQGSPIRRRLPTQGCELGLAPGPSCA